MLYSACRIRVRNGLIAGAMAVSLGSHASVELNLNVASVNNSVEGLAYVAFPGMTDLGFGNPDEEVTSFVTVSSPGDDFVGYLNHPEGTGSKSTRHPTLGALGTALNGTWNLTEQQGSQTLPYTFELDIGNLLDNGLPTTAITIPDWDAVTNPHASQFQWTLSEGIELQLVQLFKLDAQDRFESSVASQFFSDGTTGSWFPDVNLIPGARYEFQVVQQRTPVGVAVSYTNPVDSEGNSWPHGWADVTVTQQANANVRFTADFAEVPEPTAVAGGVLILAWAGWRWHRRRSAMQAQRPTA